MLQLLWKLLKKIYIQTIVQHSVQKCCTNIFIIKIEKPISYENDEKIINMEMQLQSKITLKRYVTMLLNNFFFDTDTTNHLCDVRNSLNDEIIKSH